MGNCINGTCIAIESSRSSRSPALEVAESEKHNINIKVMKIAPYAYIIATNAKR
ncbi:hypothetical protein [Methanohalophilus sp.]|uniref:hypothetical protein n=1 Tax=Methanohalophilus sp. TaxID=1966352 RepID=UPI0026146A09|nr:hypothetical protein [Methanohalophilus sp.]